MPRIVRKTPQSYQAVVLDYLVGLSEDVSVIDWDELSNKWAIPFGAFINITYWILCAQRSYGTHHTNDRVFESSTQRLNHTGDNTKWSTVLWVAIMTLTCASLANAWHCLTRQRQYQISRPVKESPSRPTTPIDQSTTSPSAEKDLVLIWDPSTASLRMFCVFSPAHAMLTWNFAESPIILGIVFILSAQLLYLVRLYEQHVKDKKLIYGQVFSEYEKNFVEPRLSIMKRDVGVGTRPDDNGVYVEVHTPKVGIIDAKTAKTVPRSASQIRMHDWERTEKAALPASPNVWAASPVKRSNGIYQGLSSRLSIASPVKAANGSPAKLFRPAGWSSSSAAGQQWGSSNSLSQDDSPQQSMKRSKTTSSLATRWE